MTKTPNVNPVLVAELTRRYNRAIDAEENASTIEEAWRLADRSELALEALRAAQAGERLKVTKTRTAKTVKLASKANALSEAARKAWATRRAMAATQAAA